MPLPKWIRDTRQPMKMPVNPLDQATIVNIFPQKITDVKYTVFPGIFRIPEGRKDNPGILNLGTSSTWKDVGPDQELIEIPIAATVMANSIIEDWSKGLLAYDRNERMPGLFWIPGKLDKEQVLSNHQKEIEIADFKQRNWYQAQIKMADVLWARTQGNPLSISNHARLAAQELGLKNKPWMQDFNTFEMLNCPMCGEMYNPAYPMCKNCKTIINPIAAANIQKTADEALDSISSDQGA